MNIEDDVLEEIKEMLEHALDRHSWPAVEDALYILKEEMGYDVDDEDEHRHVEEE
jgi:hypothetical protein